MADESATSVKPRRTGRTVLTDRFVKSLTVGFEEDTLEGVRKIQLECTEHRERCTSRQQEAVNRLTEASYVMQQALMEFARATESSHAYDL